MWEVLDAIYRPLLPRRWEQSGIPAVQTSTWVGGITRSRLASIREKEERGSRDTGKQVQVVVVAQANPRPVQGGSRHDLLIRCDIFSILYNRLQR